MKLIIVSGIHEFEEELNQVFKEVKTPIFSKVDIEGFKSEENGMDLSNWFGKDMGPDFSVMFFAFVSKGMANALMAEIKQLNLKRKKIRPFHAFQMSVEKSI